MINNITRKVQQAEKQMIKNMTEVQKAEYEIKCAGYDLGAMKTAGFNYDPEIIESPLKQAENFSESAICAANDY